MENSDQQIMTEKEAAAFTQRLLARVHPNRTVEWWVYVKHAKMYTDNDPEAPYHLGPYFRKRDALISAAMMEYSGSVVEVIPTVE